MSADRDPDVIDQVARAIYDAATLHSALADVRKRRAWPLATDLYDKYRAIARAAIEAMPPP